MESPKIRDSVRYHRSGPSTLPTEGKIRTLLSHGHFPLYPCLLVVLWTLCVRERVLLTKIRLRGFLLLLDPSLKVLCCTRIKLLVVTSRTTYVITFSTILEKTCYPTRSYPHPTSLPTPPSPSLMVSSSLYSLLTFSCVLN